MAFAFWIWSRREWRFVNLRVFLPQYFGIKKVFL